MTYTDQHLLKLYSDAKFYDIEFSERNEDIQFYRQFFNGKNGKAHEIACGTGRITSALHQAGIAVSGSDISPEMIEQAKLNYAEIQFSVADMTSITGEFDYIYCATNALQHLLDEEKLLRCLQSVYDTLNKDGQFIFDIQQPDFSKLNRDLSIPYKQKTFRINNKQCDAYITGSFDQQNKLFYFNLDYQVEGLTINEKSVCMHMITNKYISALIEQTNFSIQNIYGDFSFSKFDNTSKKQIFVLEKR